MWFHHEPPQFRDNIVFSQANGEVKNGHHPTGSSEEEHSAAHEYEDGVLAESEGDQNEFYIM